MMNSLSLYEEERKKVETETWSCIALKNAVVIDCGIGENAKSTKKLIEMGADVITVDNDLTQLVNHKDVPTHLVQCDITDFPFKRSTADAILFYFTLHEIDPFLHSSIISEVSQIASQVIIVEPSSGENASYQRYAELWREAMHAVGKFEDYQPLSYWERLVSTNGFDIVLSKSIKRKEHIPPEIIEENCQFTIQFWEEDNVPDDYIDEMRRCADYAKERGMKWSDRSVIIGQSKR